MPVDLGFLHLKTGAGHTSNHEALIRQRFLGVFLVRKRKSLSYADLRLECGSFPLGGARVRVPRHEGPLPCPGAGASPPKGSQTPAQGGTYLEVGVLREPHPPKSWIPCSLHLFLHPGLPKGHCAPSPRRYSESRKGRHRGCPAEGRRKEEAPIGLPPRLTRGPSATWAWGWSNKGHLGSLSAGPPRPHRPQVPPATRGSESGALGLGHSRLMSSR